jgi:hypothetical protein
MQKEKLSFVKSAGKLSLAIKETEEFTRFSYISGIGQSAAFTQAAFGLVPGEISGLIGIPNGYCILSLKELIPVDEEKFAQEKEKFAEELLAKRQEESFNIWLAKITQRANLINNIEKLKQRRAP